MLLSVLINKLKIDVDDETLGFNTVKRCFERAAVWINKDLETSYVVDGEDISTATILPNPTQRDQELLLILAMYHLVRVGLVAAADAINWKSGDKSVDRSRKSLSKENTMRFLIAEYRIIAGLDDVDMVAGDVFTASGVDSDFTDDRKPWIG